VKCTFDLVKGFRGNVKFVLVKMQYKTDGLNYEL